MSLANHPKVIVGLLVYNGENYLAETVESILSQTFEDFRLLIADNASTDRTEQICREYVNQDSRVVYHRHAENIGASGNHNFLFQPGESPYFKWASHDDPLGPNYLRQCVELLDQNPAFGVAHTRSYRIDGDGKIFGTLDHEVRLNSLRPSQRFWRLLWAGYLPEVHGVMRSDLIKKTKLYQGFAGDDRSFLAEMLLQTDVGYVEDYQFFRRDHASCFCNITDEQQRQYFYNPKRKASSKQIGLIKLKGYLSAIQRYPMPLSEKIACLKSLLEWGLRRGVEVASGSGEQFGEKLRQEFSADALAVNQTKGEPMVQSYQS